MNVPAWYRRLLRTLIKHLNIILLVLGSVLLLVTTPLLSSMVLWGLNHVEFEVDPVAAKVHTSGALIPEPQFEPGSPEWLAQYAEPASLQQVQDLLSEEDLGRVMDRLPAQTIEALLPKQTLAYVPLPNISATIDGKTWWMAQAIVVLGGGLGRDHERRIIPNIYTELRLSQAVLQHQTTGLPLLLSGVEAPWMQQWLLDQGVEAIWLEKRSMNTCENARFTSLLLQKHGGAAQVELVTDAYHMPRSRRLFAINGIATVPVIAPLPGDPAPWWPDPRNVVHTRRAMHEMIALTRDIWFGETNCREVP